MRIIDFISDVHLDFYFDVENRQQIFANMFANQKGTDLIICGDLFVGLSNHDQMIKHREHINLLDQFFKVANNRYQNVYFVMGNHDYWGGWLQDGEKEVEKILKDRAIVLHNSYVKVEDVLMWGSTMWTNVSNPIDYLRIQQTMGDYRATYVNKDQKRLITVDDTNLQNAKSFNSLKDLLEITDKNVVVISHHCPSYGSQVKLDKHDRRLDCGFYNKFDNFIINHQDRLKVWLHGHAHNAVQYNIDKVQVASNPFGYYLVERKSEDVFSIKSILIYDNQVKLL